MEAIWPNLMNMPPQSCRKFLIRRPPSGLDSAALDASRGPARPFRLAIRVTSSSLPPTVKKVRNRVRSDAPPARAPGAQHAPRGKR